MSAPKIMGRGRPKEITPEKTQEVISLLADGVSHRQIVELTGVSKGSVGRINQKYMKGRGKINSRPNKNGPKPRKVSEVLAPAHPTKRKPGRPPKAPPPEKKTNTLPLPKKDPGFKKFTRWLSYPAYGGAHAWQLECHYDYVWPHKFSEVNVHRKSGKSIYLANVMQYAIAYHDYDILYLGWTDRRKEVADYVFSFFEQRDMIAASRGSSNYHFSTTNGGKFDVYLITAKETLGMHPMGRQDRFKNLTDEDIGNIREMYEGITDDELDELDKAFDDEAIKKFLKERDTERKLWIIIDDPIDDTFREERHKEKTLERRFDSTIYSIAPDKWTFCGTRKFEEDFFYFIENKLGDRLHVYRRGTMVDGKPFCPERFTHPDLPTYEEDMVAGKEDLEEIRHDLGEYWWGAEWEQDPHPVTGEIWDGVAHIAAIGNPHQYDWHCISVDRATTTNQKSDLTGIVEMVRNRVTGHVIVTGDLTGKHTLPEVLDIVSDMYIAAQTTYPKCSYMVVVEKQGGGDDFIQLAEDQHFPFAAAIVDVHNVREKIQRITDYLKRPIRRQWVKLLYALLTSELEKEIKNFPYSAKLDAIDALANAVHELSLKDLATMDPDEVVAEIKKIRAPKNIPGAYKQPWERKGSIFYGL